MKTKAEIEQDARQACPYERDKRGHAPWIDGYVAAAIEYEAQIERLRDIIRQSEQRRPG